MLRRGRGHRSRSRLGAAAFAAAALAVLGGCGNGPDGGAPPKRQPPPPPTASARAGRCEGGGAKLSDAVSAPFFGAAGGFCVEAGASVGVYGEGASTPIKEICGLFDGECEIYFSFDVARTVDLALVAGDASGASVQVRLSRFATSAGAFGMYTRRVLGDGDPSATDVMPRPLDVPAGRAVLGQGNAYLVKGEHLVELLLQQDGLNEEQQRKRGDEVLPAIVSSIAQRLPGKGELPEVVQKLPKEGRLSLGERLFTKKWLSVELASVPLALGYHAEGQKRFRVLAAQAADEAGAKELLERFAKLSGATKLAGGFVRFEQAEGAAKAEWLVRARGAWVFGVGDEIRVVKVAGDPSTLGADEKRARADKLGS